VNDEENQVAPEKIWEVDFEETFMKKIRSKKVSKQSLKKANTIIQRLQSGIWRPDDFREVCFDWFIDRIFAPHT
jgi:hypothetical protein